MRILHKMFAYMGGPMTIKKNQDIKQEVIDGETILYNSIKQQIITLNETATYIWNLIGDHSIDEIENIFLDSYEFRDDRHRMQAKNDLRMVIERLYASGCIQCHD